VHRSLSRSWKALGAAVLACALAAPADARELALAQGAIAIHDAAAGEASPACTQLVVEARDGLDNHLIARTDATVATDGSCRYAISVPAQSAVWLRLRPVLVASARAGGAAALLGTSANRAEGRIAGRAVQLRWTAIAPNTYFFEPNETKNVPLTY